VSHYAIPKEFGIREKESNTDEISESSIIVSNNIFILKIQMWENIKNAKSILL
jgi:hypothetical protein